MYFRTRGVFVIVWVVPQRDTTLGEGQMHRAPLAHKYSSHALASSTSALEHSNLWHTHTSVACTALRKLNKNKGALARGSPRALAAELLRAMPSTAGIDRASRAARRRSGELASNEESNRCIYSARAYG